MYFEESFTFNIFYLGQLLTKIRHKTFNDPFPIVANNFFGRGGKSDREH
jgi:hypothetical protein